MPCSGGGRGGATRRVRRGVGAPGGLHKRTQCGLQWVPGGGRGTDALITPHTWWDLTGGGLCQYGKGGARATAARDAPLVAQWGFIR